MGRSLKLFSVRGIDIRLHFTFPLILLWAALQFGLAGGGGESALFGVIVISLLFVLVTLHELGHSFAALYYGVPVKQIVLSPIGGVAQLQEMPEKPVQEFVIAAAGPAVNLVVALLMALFIPVLGLDRADFVAALTLNAGLTATAVFAYLFVYNIFLALFNLIPAFPLDGGRIFRSLLAMKLDYIQATNIAVGVGRATAVMLGIYALFNGGIFLIFIAVFIYSVGGQEAAFVRTRHTLRGYAVRDAYSPQAYTLTPYTTLQQAVNLMMVSGQGNFPVVDGDNETLAGFVTQQDLGQAMQTRGGHAWANMIMRRVAPVALGTPLLDVQKRLETEQLGALPVVDNGRYLGIIGQWQIRHFFTLISHKSNTHPPTIIQSV
ncbi:MAG: site-2 protease family protein [Chloroflexi bacterium]|nr:site-2 protease family protein [Chloroflexota bacterium]